MQIILWKRASHKQVINNILISYDSWSHRAQSIYDESELVILSTAFIKFYYQTCVYDRFSYFLFLIETTQYPTTVSINRWLLFNNRCFQVFSISLIYISALNIYELYDRFCCSYQKYCNRKPKLESIRFNFIRYYTVKFLKERKELEELYLLSILNF